MWSIDQVEREKLDVLTLKKQIEMAQAVAEIFWSKELAGAEKANGKLSQNSCVPKA